MKKYSALSSYLSDQKEKTVLLDFSFIEKIIGASLPASAYRHVAWWANESNGTHTWSHLWQVTGWASEAVDLQRNNVTFRRHPIPVSNVLASLRPRTKETIFDLLQQTGISTEEWHIRANGTTVAKVKANPNFCYDWSFGSPREGYALCIWHGTLQLRDDDIVFVENLRELAQRLQLYSRDSSQDANKKSRAISQATRAKAFDESLKICYERGMPISVILTEGDRRSREELGEGSSHVQYRFLDPIKWYVHEYSDSTGDALLVRGMKPAGVADDLEDSEEEANDTPDELQLRAIKARRGQSKFRESLLAAYGRRCAVTGSGIVDLLEAAHIEPHSEKPNYRVTNGLLLRADIHTLFDLNLLSVDGFNQVRLAPVLLTTEYKGYEGSKLRHPGRPSEMPDKNALEQRHLLFKKKNKL